VGIKTNGYIIEILPRAFYLYLILSEFFGPHQHIPVSLEKYQLFYTSHLLDRQLVNQV